MFRYADRVDCEECARLRAEHDRLNKKYLAALDATQAAFEAPAHQFRKLRAALNEAWLDATTARLKLERHQRGRRKG